MTIRECLKEIRTRFAAVPPRILLLNARFLHLHAYLHPFRSLINTTPWPFTLHNDNPRYRFNVLAPYFPSQDNKYRFGPLSCATSTEHFSNILVIYDNVRKKGVQATQCQSAILPAMKRRLWKMPELWICQKWPQPRKHTRNGLPQFTVINRGCLASPESQHKQYNQPVATNTNTRVQCFWQTTPVSLSILHPTASSLLGKRHVAESVDARSDGNAV